MSEIYLRSGIKYKGTPREVLVAKPRTVSVREVPTYQWDMSVGSREIACRAPISFYNSQRDLMELEETLFGIASSFMAKGLASGSNASLTFFQSGLYQYVFRFDPGNGRTKVVSVPRLKTIDRSAIVSDNEYNYLHKLGQRMPELFLAPESRMLVQFGLKDPSRVVRPNIYPDLVNEGFIEITVVDLRGSLCFNFNALNFEIETLRLAKKGQYPKSKYDLFSLQLSRRFYAAIVKVLVAGYSFSDFLGISEFSVGAGDIVMKKPLSEGDPLEMRCITVRGVQNVSFPQYLDYIRGLEVNTFNGQVLPFYPIAKLNGAEFSKAVAAGLKARYPFEDALGFYRDQAYPALVATFK